MAGLTFTFGLRKWIQNHSNGLPGAIEKVKEVRVEILMIKLLQNFRVLNQAIILVKTVTLFLFISQLIINFFFLRPLCDHQRILWCGMQALNLQPQKLSLLHPGWQWCCSKPQEHSISYSVWLTENLHCNYKRNIKDGMLGFPSALK